MSEKTEQVSRSATRWAVASRVIFGVVVVVGSVGFGFYSAAANVALQDRYLDTVASLDDARVDANRLYEQLAKSGQTPEVVPEARTAPIPGEKGARGPQGVPGDAGPAGVAGVAGADGAPGTDGTNGADGVDGQLGADGADGAPGPQGPSGADGRGISSVECAVVADGVTAFRFTFTDGTTQDVAGACTPPPVP